MCPTTQESREASINYSKIVLSSPNNVKRAQHNKFFPNFLEGPLSRCCPLKKYQRSRARVILMSLFQAANFQIVTTCVMMVPRNGTMAKIEIWDTKITSTQQQRKWNVCCPSNIPSLQMTAIFAWFREFMARRGSYCHFRPRCWRAWDLWNLWWSANQIGWTK